MTPYNKNAARDAQTWNRYLAPTAGYVEQVYLLEPLADEGDKLREPGRLHGEAAVVTLADDRLGERVKAAPGGDVGEVGHPQLIGPRGRELAPHPIPGRLEALIGNRRAAFASPHNAAQTERAHQPLHGAARRGDPLAPELAPDLASPVHTEVLLVDALDLGNQRPVASQPRRQAPRIGSAGLVRVVL